MKGIVALACEVYVGAKILGGMFKLGEKVGEAKALHDFGKDIKSIYDQVNKESE